MKLLIVIMMILSSVVVSAQTRIVSIDALDLSYTGGLLVRHEKGKGPDRDTTNFRFNLNYAQNIEQYVGLMWKAKAYINKQNVDYGNNDVNESAWGAAGGVLYNLQPNDIKNSIMFGAMVGLERATYELGTIDDKSGFNLFLDLEGGKRWDLGTYSVANISYAPTIAVNVKRYGGDLRDHYFKSSREIRFNFLKFDILF
ncbi:MAG: hypothetical protein AB7I27_15005 [Bacteriovoracaceae bacterium]